MVADSKIPDAHTRDEFSVLALLILFLAGKLLWIKSIHFMPIIFGDETLYREGANRIFNFDYFYSQLGPLFPSRAFLPAGASIDHLPLGYFFPLGYPLAIAPGFLLDDYHYGILFLNGALTTAVVWVLFRAARDLGFDRQAQWLVVALTCLSPLHLFNLHVMSENLAFLLVALLAWIGFAAPLGILRRSALFGMTLGAAYLTRYAILALFPFFIAGFCYIHRRELLASVSAFTSVAVLGALGLAVPLGGWLLYAYASGTSLLDSLGASGATTILGEAVERSGAGVYLLQYAAFAILACGPFLAVLMVFGRSWRALPEQLRVLLLIVFAATILMVYISARHSVSAHQATGQPYILGRYVVLLLPLLALPAVGLLSVGGAVSRGWSIAAAIVMAVLIIAAYFALFGNFDPHRVAGVNGYFVDIYSPGRLGVPGSIYLWGLVPTVLILGWFAKRRGLVSLLLVGNALVVATLYVASTGQPRELKALREMISPFQRSPETLDFYLGSAPPAILLTAQVYFRSMHFFNFANELRRISIHAGAPPALLAEAGQTCGELVYGGVRAECRRVQTPQGWLVAYGNNLVPTPLPRSIVEFGPRQVRRGVRFNPQGGGDSALWLRADGPIPGNAIVVMGSSALQTTVVGDVATALVPSQLLQSAGSLEVYISNPITGQRTSSVTLQITD